MSVLGIDPSISGTGIALLDGWQTIRTSPSHDMGQRLTQIHEAILDAAGSRTRLAVVESLPKNAQSAGLTGMAHGVVLLALYAARVPVVTVPPATLKVYATGSGRADKADMRMALYQRAGLDLRDDNQVDAWWLRAIGDDLLGSPSVILPKTHRRALDKLTLPIGVS